MYKDFFKHKIASICFLITMLLANNTCQALKTAVRFDDGKMGICENNKFVEELVEFGPSMDFDFKVQFNPYNKNILFNRSSTCHCNRTNHFHGNYFYEIWDVSEKVCVGFIQNVTKGNLTFCPTNTNLVAYVSKDNEDNETVCIYDTSLGKDIRRFPCKPYCSGIHFSKKYPDYLMVAQEGGVIKYHHVKNERLDKKDAVRLDLDGFFYKCIFSDYNEDNVFWVSPYDVIAFDLRCNGGSPVKGNFPRSMFYVSLIDNETIAREVFREKKKEVTIFKSSTMKAFTALEVSGREEFLGKFYIKFFEDEIIINDVITKKEEVVFIPDDCLFKVNSKFKIKEEQDSFILALVVTEKETEQEKIIFYDSDKKEFFCELKDEEGRKILDFDFYLNFENGDPFLEEKIVFLITELNELELDNESGQEEAQRGTEEHESGQGQARGQKIFKDSIVTLNVFVSDPFSVYKSMF